MDDGRWAERVSRARAGEPHAMDDLIAAVQPLVERRCAKFLPHQADAQEAVQETLLTIATRLDDFSGRGSFPGWVTAVSSNCALQVYRSLRRRFVETGDESTPEIGDPRTTSVIAGTRIDLLDALERLESDHPSAVEAFVLRDLGALPYDEIAALTQTPVGTIKARVHTARNHVRKNLSASEGNFSP